MLYPELLKVIREKGFDEVGRWKVEGKDECASIASKRTPIIVPLTFPNRLIILENGDESDIDDEVIQALFRWMEQQNRKRKS